MYYTLSGDYCENAGMTNTSGECLGGYYCVRGASVEAPQDGSTGNICAAGYYCPTGSVHQIPCVNGTYTNYTGKSSSTWLYTQYFYQLITVSFSNKLHSQSVIQFINGNR